MNASKVTVAIVSYNTVTKLSRCLECLPSSSEIIVVDNASEDGSAEMVAESYPHVRLIRNDRNRGFGPANNQALEASTHELILYLNSDAYALPGAIEQLAASFADPNVIAAGGMLLNPDGTLQNSTANQLTLWAVFCEQTLLEKAFPRSKVFAPYWNTRRLLDDGLTPETEQVMGACLMTRAKDVRWDERFFLYCEDTDLCRRLRRKGRVIYVPSARFTHELGSSSRDRSIAIGRYNRGKEIYFRIHHGVVPAAICLLLDRMGALIRFLGYAATSFRPASRDRLKQWWRVLTFPVRGPDNAAYVGSRSAK
jgi:GT2 family glycosyltransferase